MFDAVKGSSGRHLKCIPTNKILLLVLVILLLKILIYTPTIINQVGLQASCALKSRSAGTSDYTQFSSNKCRRHCKCTLIKDDLSPGLSCMERTHMCPFKLTDFGELICPQQFRNLADWVYGWDALHHGENIHFANYTNIVSCLPRGAIIYVTTLHLDQFFADIYPLLRHPFVLITGESIISVPQPHHYPYLTDKRSKIIHWFGQNGQVAAAGSTLRFTHIPLGLNCHEHSAAMLDIHRQHANDEIIMNYYNSKLKPPKWLLFNFIIESDSTGERDRLLRRFCNRKRYNYTLCIHKERGVKQYLPRLAKIYRRNMRIPFWVSPRGSGLDCHRTWEALLLGPIPIVLRSNISAVFDQLPVWQVDSWNELDDLTVIQRKFKEITAKRNRYALERLRFSYWRQLVLEKSAYKDILSDDGKRPPRCWEPARGRPTGWW